MSIIANLRHRFLYGILMNARSNIVCAGAGGDISFELELHEMTGATVHLLDPSPTGIQTYQQAKTPGVIYHETGLSGDTKKHTFALPKNPEEGSYKDPRFDSEGMETVTFDCVSVDDFMKRHNMASVDLLKMDIEGFEYEVLRSILGKKTPVRQICVEFHNLKGPLLSGIIRYLWIIRLRLHGYSLISHVGTTDHTFMKL
jgi:FkbM family methyltransferase